MLDSQAVVEVHYKLNVDAAIILTISCIQVYTTHIVTLAANSAEDAKSMF